MKPKPKPRTASKKVSHKKVTLVNPGTPGAVELDFTSDKDSSRVVVGTPLDLIRDGYDHPMQWVWNLHADPKENRAAVLMGRGDSATLRKRKMIAKAGIPVMAINDIRKDGPKPRYWCSGDPPGYFSERMWTDPDIMKFIGIHNREGVRPRDGAYEPKRLAKEAPNTFFFHQATDEMDVEHWLFHPFIAWGSTIGCEGGPKQLYAKGSARSSMFIGLKLLFFLGYRRVYLLGCDCVSHHHPSPEYWNTVFHLMGVIAPHFKRWGLNVYQCNYESHLRCFEFADFEKAVA